MTVLAPVRSAPKTLAEMASGRPVQPMALKPNALKRADLERGNFIAIVPIDTTFEDVMRPSYWQHHVAALNRPFARIEVVREDCSMDLDLRVVQTAPGMAVVRCLRKYLDDRDLKLGTAEAEGDDADLVLPPGYKTTNIPAGENKGWRVTMPNGDQLVGKVLKRSDAVRKAMEHYALASGSAAAETPVT